MMMLNRRLALLISSRLLPDSPTANKFLDYVAIQHSSDVICNYSPRSFRKAVKVEDLFLYRGNDTPVDRIPYIDRSKPDLLMESTYEDPLALGYFECLERSLGTFPARPSTGHIATSDQQEASQWGELVSVWPLGSNMAYVWPENNEVFFPTRLGDNCESSELVLNQGLSKALQKNREVLFTSWFDRDETFSFGIRKDRAKSIFLIIPSKFDNQLKIELRKRNYGL